MKHFLLSIVLALAICVTASRGDEPKKHFVSLVRVGDADEALVKRAQEWAQQNLAIAVPLLDAQPAGKGSLDEQGHKLAKLLKPGDVGLVALVSDDKIKDAMVLLHDAPVVVINIHALKEGVASDEALGRRVEREVMRGIGLLAGLDPCPDPFCVMTACATVSDLDHMGRNFCPPCLTKLQKKAASQGIPLLPDNAYNTLGSGPH